MCHENAHNNTVDVRFSLLTALFVFNGEIKGTFIVCSDSRIVILFFKTEFKITIQAYTKLT